MILIIGSLILTGCMTEKKKSDIFHRYARENRSEVLVYCPPIEESVVTGKTDTVTQIDTVIRRVPVIVKGDTVMADCPETEVMYRVVRRTDTVIKKDVAQLELLMIERNRLDKELAIKTELYNQEKNKSKYLIFAIIGLVVVFFIIRR